MARSIRRCVAAGLAALLCPAAGALGAREAPPAPRLRVVATSPTYAWNGVAVAADGRVFANMPRWDKVTPSVVVIGRGGALTSYPGGRWNDWHPGVDPRASLVSVNALYVDRSDNHLWIVDSGNPVFGRAIAGGPKLVEIDLATDRVVHVYPFDDAAAPAKSYLNDVRISGRYAFVTDSGTGAILVLDRVTGVVRRRLGESRLTKGDQTIVAVVDGRRLSDAQGRPPAMQVDELELSPDQRTLFFMAPTGPNLYRVAVADLIAPDLDDDALERRVTIDRRVPPVGGIGIAPDGTLYLSEVETHSVRAVGPDGRTRFVVTDPRLDWPDAFAFALDGSAYVVASQVDELPGFHGATDARRRPYYLFRLTAPGTAAQPAAAPSPASIPR